MKARLVKSGATVLGVMLFINLFLQSACSVPRETRAVYVLLDIPVSSDQQFDKMQGILRHLLGSLQPGESLALARIDSNSFNEKDIIARMSFDLRPSVANSQKRAFLESIEHFRTSIRSSKYTDFTGGILQAIEYLNETRASQRFILIVSDLKEEIKKGQIRDFPISFEGIHVMAINIDKLDNENTGEYQHRVQKWSQRVVRGGGNWEKIDDLTYLDEIIK
jgi:hypothetical protein